MRHGIPLGVLVALTACTPTERPPTPTLNAAPIAVPVATQAPAPAPRPRRRGDAPRNSNGTRKTFAPAPPDLPGRTMVLAYDAFGPQVLAAQLLGDDCYPFGACCCMEVGDAFDIRVVVTRGVTEAEAKAMYPTGPETGDYRIVTLERALAFLVASRRELESGDRIPSLEATLADTEAKLRRAFPGAR